MVSRSLLTLLLPLALAGCATPRDGGVRADRSAGVEFPVSLNGKRASWTYHSEIQRSKARPEPGDLIEVQGAAIPLAAGESSLELVRDEGETLRWRSGGSLLPVRADCVRTFDDEYREVGVENGLASLTLAERRGLRMVRLEAWNDEIARHLADTDPAKCFYLLSRRAFEREYVGKPGEGHYLLTLPALPVDTRHLGVDLGSWGMTRYDYSRLAKLNSLTTLNLRDAELGIDEDESNSNLEHLKGAKKLRVLSLPRHSTVSLSPLSGLEALEALDLDTCREIHDLEPLQNLRALRRIRLSGCAKVESLAALADLPALEAILASTSGVRDLPEEGFEALRLLDVMSTKVSEEAVLRFRASHPDCTIRDGWLNRFRKAIRGVTDIRIHSIQGPGKDGQVLLELSGDQVQEFVSSFQVPQQPSDLGWCSCMGSQRVRFVNGERTLATVTLHHGASARWSGWPTDASLSKSTRAYLLELLPELRERREKEERKHRERERHKNRFLGFFPEGVRKLMMRTRLPGALMDLMDKAEDPTNLYVGTEAPAAILEAAGDPVALAVACCKALGTGCEPEGGCPHEDLAQATGRLIDAESFAAALGRLKDDPQALVGATEIVFDSNLYYPNEDHFRKALPKSKRAALTVRLVEAVVAKGSDWQKITVLHQLDPSESTEIEELLLRLARGGSETEVTSHKRILYLTPGVRASSYLLLARSLRHDLIPEIKRKLQSRSWSAVDRAALEVSLGLLGETVTIRADHLESGTPLLIHGALEILHDSRGIYAVPLLMEALNRFPGRTVTKQGLRVATVLTGQGFSDLHSAMEWWRANRSSWGKDDDQ